MSRSRQSDLDTQAVALLREVQRGDAGAVDRIRARLVRDSPPFILHDARLTLAREHGFDSWAALRLHVESDSMTARARRAAFLGAAWVWGDRVRAEALLRHTPELAATDIYCACAAVDPGAVAGLLDADSRRALRPGGPRRWPPVLYASWSCFSASREQDAVTVLRLLLQHGAKPDSAWLNRRWNVKESALYGTVEANSTAAARVLLEAGADPNDGESLYHACEKGNVELLDALARHGLKREDVSYCIKHAIDFGWHEGVVWFLEQGADPDAVHPQARESSLHWAVKRNCGASTIRALLEAGADPDARTSAGYSAFPRIKGRTPHDFARRLGRSEIAELLVEHGARPSEESPMDRFVHACTAGNARRARSVLSRQSRLVEQLDADDRNLVAHVAQMGSWAAVRLMIDIGWPVDAEGWMGATPLTWALCYGDAKMVDFLLARGAGLASVGDYFENPLHTVIHCRWRPGDHAAALERLLREGIDVPDDVFPCGDADLDRVLETHLRHAARRQAR